MKTNRTIGLDIGTTTISAVLRDTQTGAVLAVRNIPNDTNLPSSHPWEHMQNPEQIREKTEALLIDLCRDGADAIGITGQMHGILQTDREGRALSPLYTWQDGRAGLGAVSACGEILSKTGYRTSAGYGLATHFALLKAGDVPENAACLCTVMDYIAMGLCGLSRPVIHATNAASLGLYRMDADTFDVRAAEVLGMDSAILPEVTNRCRILGEWKNIPVAAAIGDNQAAFLGSVQDRDRTVLVNIGTGSQITMTCGRDAPILTGSVETRPFLEDSRILSGSGLCGGRAYAILEKFFRGYAAALGLPDTERYDVLNRLAEKGLAEGKILSVRTTFCGTREDPDLLGQITDIGENDLTPEGLAAGVLNGMVQELYGMYDAVGSGKADILAASGNAVRKNPVLQRILADTFGMPVQIPDHTEEAAYGAALFAQMALDTGTDCR